MNIYSSSDDTFFIHAPNGAKRLLNNSLSRTLHGFDSIRAGSVLKGCGHILAARVQSVAAYAMVTLSSLYIVPLTLIALPCFIVPATALNLASRLPGISTLQPVQRFTKRSSDVIYRSLKVNVLILPVIFTFQFTAIVNTFMPGLLKTENVFLRAIHRLVRYAGPLQIKRVTVPGAGTATGYENRNSALSALEEYLRALSYKNHIKETFANHVIVHHTTNS